MIAIVKDAGCIEPEHYWSGVWERLCRENKIDYLLADSSKESFVSEILSIKPDITLWRSSHRQLTKQKDILQRYHLDRAGLKILPDWNMRYLYDNKISQTYLFQAKGYPHPKTWIFFDYGEAREYIEKAKYPFVVKANAGAGSASTRFIETKKQALSQLEENFSTGLETSDKYREKGLFYAQEYIKTDGIFRIVMVGDDVGYSFYQSNKPGTITASSQGYDSYPDTPIALLTIASTINKEQGWAWMMYDFIYDANNQKWLILEITDTCGFGHSSKRKYTYCRHNHEWKEKEDNRTPAELIFRKFIGDR